MFYHLLSRLPDVKLYDLPFYENPSKLYLIFLELYRHYDFKMSLLKKINQHVHLV